jgi:hypothetical protein
VAAAIEVLLLVRLLRHHFLEMVDFVLYTFTFHMNNFQIFTLFYTIYNAQQGDHSASPVVQRRWCSGNINAFQAFALGSIPGRRNSFGHYVFHFSNPVTLLGTNLRLNIM